MDHIIGVVGLGTMGLGIAQVYAQAGFTVLATDSFDPMRASALTRLESALAPRVASGRMTQAEATAITARLTIVPTLAALAPCTLIVEAVREDLAIKQALFAELETHTGPATVLATNTSSLSIASVAATLARPANLLGLHFFNPAPVMKLVELIPQAQTAPAALALAQTLTAAAGKTVIAAPDRPGFIVNRCARPFYGEALALLEEGRTASDIDAAMLAAGYRIGPLSLIDLVGADVHLAATEGVFNAMNHHPRYHVFAPLRAQVAKGDLGRKTGKGFLFPATPGPAPTDAADIALRIEATLVNEAASLLAEGTTAESIDQAMTLGLNFPRGPFAAARAQGFDRIRHTLHELDAKAPPTLTGRYTLTDPLTTLG